MLFPLNFRDASTLSSELHLCLSGSFLNNTLTGSLVMTALLILYTLLIMYVTMRNYFQVKTLFVQYLQIYLFCGLEDLFFFLRQILIVF